MKIQSIGYYTLSMKGAGAIAAKGTNKAQSGKKPETEEDKRVRVKIEMREKIMPYMEDCLEKRIPYSYQAIHNATGIPTEDVFLRIYFDSQLAQKKAQIDAQLGGRFSEENVKELNREIEARVKATKKRDKKSIINEICRDMNLSPVTVYCLIQNNSDVVKELDKKCSKKYRA